MNKGKPRASAPRFVVVGGGMAGILSAIKLREAGLTDFTVYEKADRLGGTWRDNTYPGIGCDVPSHLYSYSFAPNPDWTHLFSPGEEIRAYLEAVARRYDVERYIRCGTEVSRLEFRAGRWHIETADGGRDEADVVIAATGVLHTPPTPTSRAWTPSRAPCSTAPAGTTRFRSQTSAWGSSARARRPYRSPPPWSTR